MSSQEHRTNPITAPYWEAIMNNPELMQQHEQSMQKLEMAVDRAMESIVNVERKPISYHVALLRRQMIEKGFFVEAGKQTNG